MLICLVGPPQAGKDSLARFLVDHDGFTRVRLAPSSDASALHFVSTSEFLDHATRTWRKHFVTTDLVSKQKLAEFAKRPFVAVVAVDAPLGVRFKRAVKRAQDDGRSPPSLDQFVEADDLLYHGSLPLLSSVPADKTPSDALSSLSLAATTPAGPLTPTKRRLSPLSEAPPSPTPSPARLTPDPSPELVRDRQPAPHAPEFAQPTAPSADSTLSSILPLASLTIPNPHATLAPFLSSFSLPLLAEILRPSWDTYFMLLASLASLRSNCMKRRVGAVLVRDKRVVSTGYNGTPRGVRNCGEGGCGRCNSHGDGLGGAGPASGSMGAAGGMSRVGEALDECLCLHAEENALLEAGRERVSGGGAEGAVLYCNTCPCLRCTVKIVQCGVKEVIYSLSYSMDVASRRVMEEAGVVLRQMPQPPFPR